ncbi:MULTISPECIES: DUF3824 domain-containing protein [unclassified Actinomyces]|uniref:DUF3824 domain-containing protein n=1 Tax=unclassified Actinomyces TaxID=2609248 RepID=UPI0011BE4D08|nr:MULTISPECIES: DUF3824 domain-containing protein [unclassified Actinomyces]
MSSPNQFQPGPYSTPPYGYVPQPGGYPQSAAQPGAWQPPQTLAAGQYPPAQQSPSGFPAYPNAQQPTPYGYIATPPTPYPVRPRRKQVALISALAVVLVLAITGSIVLVLRGRGTDDVPENSLWSQAWVDGFEEAWSLEAPADFHGQEMSTRVHDNRLVRITSTSTTATVTVFDISGDSPEQLWETQQEVTEVVDRTRLWDRQIIVENTLIDIDSQARSAAPWDAEARVSVTSAGAIACVETTCRCWSSPSEMLWETDFATDSPMTVLSYAIVDGHVLASSSDYDYFVVDLNTGATNQLDADKYTIQQPLADGWLVHTSGDLHADATIDLYEADGTLSESFKFNRNTSFSAYPWSPTPFTREQARLWLESFDTSWAPSTYTISEADHDCQSITINGNDVVLGEPNSLVQARRGGACTSTSALQALYHSGQGQVQSFNKTDGDEQFLVLVDMVTGRSSEPIPLGTREEFAGYTPLGDMLIVELESGEILAYRPTTS